MFSSSYTFFSSLINIYIAKFYLQWGFVLHPTRTMNLLTTHKWTYVYPSYAHTFYLNFWWHISIRDGINPFLQFIWLDFTIEDISHKSLCYYIWHFFEYSFGFKFNFTYNYFWWCIQFWYILNVTSKIKLWQNIGLNQICHFWSGWNGKITKIKPNLIIEEEM